MESYDPNELEQGMTNVFFNFKRIFKDNSGATAIEYGLIAALVSVAAVVSLQNLGSSLNLMFSTVSTQLDTAVAAAGSP